MRSAFSFYGVATVTSQVPVLELSSVLVAVTVYTVPLAASAESTRSLSVLNVAFPSEGATEREYAGEERCVPETLTVRSIVDPATAEVGSAVMLTLLTEGVNAVTVTLQVSDLDASSVLVAVTV